MAIEVTIFALRPPEALENSAAEKKSGFWIAPEKGAVVAADVQDAIAIREWHALQDPPHLGVQVLDH
jgi:hypothetical protein